MSNIQHKDLSSLATGILLKKTKVSTDNRQGVIESINIYPEQDIFNVKYRIERLDAKGNPFGDVSYNTKTVIFRDEARKGTVDFDIDGFPDWTTFVETDPENLNVTDWYSQLGIAILGSAIAYVEGIENL